MARTLVLIKPDAVRRNLIGEIIKRIEQIGCKIVGLNYLKPTREKFYTHYETIGKLRTRTDDVAFNRVLNFLMEGPIVACLIEGDQNTIESIRKLIGSTEPIKANPGTIRGDYSTDSYEQAVNDMRALNNLVHASANSEEAFDEIELWFPKNK